MRKILLILLIIVLAFLLQQFLPFWGLALGGFLAGIILPAKTGPGSFVAGFFAGLFLWAGMAYFQQAGDAGALADHVSGLMGAGSKWTLLAVTALLGGVLGGMSCMSGYFLRSLVSPSS